MKPLFILFLFSLCLTAYSQQTYNYKDIIIYVPAVPVVSTFLIVNSMNVPAEYPFTSGMHQVRNRQRMTVALTGMVLTAATCYVVERTKLGLRKRRRY